MGYLLMDAIAFTLTLPVLDGKLLNNTLRLRQSFRKTIIKRVLRQAPKKQFLRHRSGDCKTVGLIKTDLELVQNRFLTIF